MIYFFGSIFIIAIVVLVIFWNSRDPESFIDYPPAPSDAKLHGAPDDEEPISQGKRQPK